MTNKETARRAIERRLAAIARRSVGLPVNHRAPRLTPPTALVSLERMAQLVAQVSS